MKPTKHLLSIITSALLSVSAFASIADTNKEADLLIKENMPQKAIELLEASYKAGEFNNDTLFLLGMAHKRNKDLYSAEEYFRELLKRDGAAHRARLELASVQYSLGKLMNAENNLRIVKASNPPKKVGNNIDEFLQVIAEGKPKAWNSSYTLGYMFDTNVNAGPDGETIVGGLPAGNQKKEDWALLIGARTSYTAIYSDEYALMTSFGANMTKYHKEEEYDSLVLALSSGPVIRKGRATYSLPIVATRMMIDQNPQYKKTSLGINPRMQYAYNNKLTFGGDINLAQSHVRGSSDYKPKTQSVGANVRYMWSESVALSANTSRIKERIAGSSSTLGYDGQTYGLGFSKYFDQQLSLHVNPSIKYSDYEDTTRKDKTKTLSTALNYYIPSLEGTAAASYNYTKNTSNAATNAFDYDRRQVMLMFSRSF